MKTSRLMAARLAMMDNMPELNGHPKAQVPNPGAAGRCLQYIPVDCGNEASMQRPLVWIVVALAVVVLVPLLGMAGMMGMGATMGGGMACCGGMGVWALVWMLLLAAFIIAVIVLLVAPSLDPNRWV